MKNNYADWEITSLLPLNNINYNLLIKNDNNIVKQKENKYYSDDKFKKVWSWEDIRLYLKEKGFQIEIDNYNIANIYSEILFTKLYKSLYQEPFNTYEEARREAIIYCLNLIKENEKTN